MKLIKEIRIEIEYLNRKIDEGGVPYPEKLKIPYTMTLSEAKSLLFMADELERLRGVLEKIKETYDTAYPSSFSELRTTMDIIEDITEEALKGGENG